MALPRRKMTSVLWDHPVNIPQGAGWYVEQQEDEWLT